MKITGWKKLFASHILERGADYYEDGRVEILDVSDGTVTAEVTGSEDYEVEIELAGDTVIDMYCSCPYADGGENCKHMAAALFELEDYEPRETKPKSGGDLEKAVMSMEPEEAKKLLLELCRSDGEIAERVLIRSNGKITADQFKRWQKELDRMSGRYSDRHGLFDSDALELFADEIVDFLDEKVPELLNHGMVMEAFALVDKAVMEANYAEDSDDEGVLTTVYESCENHCETILEHADAGQRRQIYDWFAKEYKKSREEYGGYPEYVENMLFDRFTDEESLKKSIELVDDLIASHAEDGDGFKLTHFVNLRMELMKRAGFSQDKTGEFEKKFYHLPSVRQVIIDRYLAAEQYGDAIKVLKNSKKLDRDTSRLVSKHSKALIGIYRKLGRTEELRAELTEYIENHRQFDLEYIKMLKEVTPAEEWPKLAERLLTLDSVKPVEYELMEHEGQYRCLLDAILERGDMFGMQRYAQSLIERFPEEMMNFYTAYLRAAMETASTRKQYADLIRMLSSLRELPGGAETVRKLAKEWRLTYPRRKSMIDEMNKAGM